MSKKHQEVILHFIFTPKYRRAIFVEAVATRLEEITRGVCQDLNVEILALAIRPDHVHLLISLPRSMTRGKLAQRVKGRASRFLRLEFPHLVEMMSKALWGKDYYVRSVGSRSQVRKYIEDHNI